MRLELGLTWRQEGEGGAGRTNLETGRREMMKIELTRRKWSEDGGCRTNLGVEK